MYTLLICTFLCCFGFSDFFSFFKIVNKLYTYVYTADMYFSLLLFWF